MALDFYRTSWTINPLSRDMVNALSGSYMKDMKAYAGESLEVFFSTRFTPQVMPAVLAEAGLTLLQTFLFDSQEEAIYLCARA